MKGLISFAAVLSLVALACGDSTVDTAGGADPPPASTAAVPSTSAPPANAPPTPPDGTALVAITGTLTTGPDGLVEVCRPGEVEGCFGVTVDGDLGEAALGDPTRAHRLAGAYDGRTITLTEPPVEIDLHVLRQTDFSTPCDEVGGSGGTDAIEPVQRYAASVPDSYAGAWWDDDARVFTVWFTGDDVSAHQDAIDGVRGDAEVCVIGGADHTERELLTAQNDVVAALASELGMSAAWTDTLRNRVVVEAEHVDADLLGRVAQIHPGIEVLAFFEVLDGPVTDLPPPLPVRPGDVDLVTGDTRARGGMDALGLFTLRFDADLGCFYFESDEGGRVLPIWPLGFSAVSGPPAQVFDRDGQVYASDGDRLEVGGGSGASQQGSRSCASGGTWVLNI